MQLSNPKHDKLVVYQIFTRLFGNQNLTNNYYGSLKTNGVGKFNDITAVALQALKDFGISHVWYTGVIEHATMTDYSDFGIKPDNPLIVKGMAGSPYAIKDYYDVDPDLAVDVDKRMDEFEALLIRTHEANLKVIIDFVPNHVARQYSSDAKPAGVRDFGEGDRTDVVFDPQNNFYYLPNEPFHSPEEIISPVDSEHVYNEVPAKATGNDVFNARPSIYDWYETIKLNYGVDYLNGHARYFDPIPATWLQMRDILLYWTQKGVDGFRCDMAEMVPVEFWGWVIPEIQAMNPDIIFIAEIYNPSEYHNYIFKGKFDYLYDKVGLYNYLRPIMEGNGTVEYITRLWQNESGDIAHHMLRFLENHDEQRIASRFFAHDPWVAIPAMTLSATLHTGPMMIYFGQEVGVNPTESEGFQGDDGRTTIFDYWGVPEFQRWVNQGKFDGGKLDENQKKLRQFYHDLNHFAVENEAIRIGDFYDLQYVNIDDQSPEYDKTRTYAYLRYTSNQRFVCVYNFDKIKTISTRVKIPSDVLSNTLKIRDVEPCHLVEVFPGNSLALNLDVAEIENSGIPVSLRPLSVIILEIKN
ncbi:alpha-amylase family protein [Persicitalea jodogahamensis]|uniref:Alpha-amylase n=1 Tax=Persicitalea jodogahamensis TaxID=402147 RepID=A0A8J3D6R7_9BACT|nr:alpha-amylase family protein [Persicitalea jodogahamensis]GHB81553.1 alpha-amylase [Persicitalea jodogahamensis]